MKQLPQQFRERMSDRLGDEFRELELALDRSPPTSIRLNPQKPSNWRSAGTIVPWCSDGRYLDERPKFHLDPFWHAGAYYVQDASSMFLEQVFRQQDLPPEPLVLDVCAAPGGKSTHLLSMMDGKGMLVANEVVRKRTTVLTENIIKWGYPNVIVTQASVPELVRAGMQYDVVLVDAPCSGEGLFRKDEKSIVEWSPEHVASCAVRQENILNDISRIVRPGGWLIYSTCTWSARENEEQVKRLVDSGEWQHIDLDTGAFGGISAGINGLGLRFYPHRISGEGFFIACLRKKGILDPLGHHHSHVKPSAVKQPLQDWIDADPELTILEKDEHQHLFPLKWSKLLHLLQRSMAVPYFGIKAGMNMNGRFKPFHSLALSGLVSGSVPSIDLETGEAVQYLRKEAVRHSTSFSEGWCIVRHKGITLGWCKVLTNRINNYYPKSWSIRP
jgi:16S rRNA C967 or C1407 C5-methylase (RsmB/RsmF family)/NOL1/NOP2/fmu family ribosome biogenesis protein